MVRIDVFGLGEQEDKLLSRDPVDCFRKYARQRRDPLDILWSHHVSISGIMMPIKAKFI